MLDILNVFFLAGVMLSNIVLYSDGDYQFQEARESVVEVSMFREWWRDDGKRKCRYTGVMVPFVRDWELVRRHRESETVLPPEPNKTAGQAFIINRKVCGEVVEPVFRVADIWSANGALREHAQFSAYDVTEMRPDQRPKWLDQVLRRIERVAVHDAKAKKFLADIKSSSLKLPEDLDATVKSLGEPNTAQMPPTEQAPSVAQ